MRDGDPDRSVTVAVQGELGSYSELAAFEFFCPDVDILACPSFVDLFDAVAQGQAGFGMAPVDNSLAGSIHPVWDLLALRHLPIAGEISLRIEHCLIGHPGTRLEEVRRIYSHPQALAQCQAYLQTLTEVTWEEVYDTAGAVKMIRENNHKEEAAIASAQAAIDYSMAILVENIQTSHHNYTRFLVLSHEPCEWADQPLKTTLVLELDKMARGLPEVLASLTRRQIQVLKVESRKRLGHPWVYLIYLELEGGTEESGVAAAMEEIKTRALSLHLIGSYPAGRICEPRLHVR